MSWQANAQQDAENAQDTPAEPEQDSKFVDAVQAIADDEEFDDRIRGMAGTMVDAFKAMRQELDGLKSMRGYYEDMQRQQMAQYVDQTFASLGDNYAELFGRERGMRCRRTPPSSRTGCVCWAPPMG